MAGEHWEGDLSVGLWVQVLLEKCSAEKAQTVTTMGVYQLSGSRLGQVLQLGCQLGVGETQCQVCGCVGDEIQG